MSPSSALPTLDHDRLRAAREAAKVRRETLCHELGVTLKTVYRWERGDAVPSLPQAVRLAELVSVDLHDLVIP
jgi:DNA-binding XRE family transcriptional regulator